MRRVDGTAGAGVLNSSRSSGVPKLERTIFNVREYAAARLA